LIRGDIDTPVPRGRGAILYNRAPLAVPPTRWLPSRRDPNPPNNRTPRLEKARRRLGKMTRDVEMAPARYPGEGGVAYPPRHHGGEELDDDGKKKRTGKQIKFDIIILLRRVLNHS
jgi:hypothetical protein